MPNANVKKVLIVGGGIGGLSTAIALGKIGIETEIIELKQKWEVYGVGIFQPPNSLRALDEIGVADKCMELGYNFDGMAYCDSQGNQFAEPQAPKIDGYPGLNVISRRTLHDILFEEAKSVGTKFRMGTTVAAIYQEEDQAQVKLTEGSMVTADLVIGSDGQNSKVRDLMFGPIEQEYVGQAVWRYTLPRMENIKNSILYYGPNAKAGLVPMSEDEMYLLLTTSEPGNPRMPEDQLDQLLRDRLADFGGQVAEAREQIVDPNEVVYRPIFSFILPSPWYKGRVLLIGDASHCTAPHLGQGASLAIEDAVVLSELIQQGLSVPQLLSAFIDRRYERCCMLVENCHQLVKWEFLEWEGKLPEDANFAKFSYETLAKMNEAI
ncbi:FAD-dependent monooxygenase [Gracilibacillus sp. YIM 98692]|uniref:FAD-dependent monooxygenase n=1 Tax=Gracilibacillus sp. YIM 98692 TaxID=2663532 RepID=UPI0013D27895|nr:FAD-dependent monooxygenase [Gracilibacillus sp. YIM 98692]